MGDNCGENQFFDACAMPCDVESCNDDVTCDNSESVGVCRCVGGFKLSGNTCVPENACPADVGEPAEWGEWTACSKSCGTGKQRRNRFCKGPGACPDSVVLFEARECLEADCPELSEWSDWSECSATCGGGWRSRDRSCLVDNCVGETSETENCNENDCVLHSGNGNTCSCDRDAWSCYTSFLGTGCGENERCEKINLDPIAPYRCVAAETGHCVAKGDPHLTTFDGKHFDIYGIGTYHMVQSLGETGLPKFTLKRQFCVKMIEF